MNKNKKKDILSLIELNVKNYPNLDWYNFLKNKLNLTKNIDITWTDFFNNKKINNQNNLVIEYIK